MPTNIAALSTTTVRRPATVALIAASCVAASFLFAAPAQADGFVDKCAAFATAASGGKAPPSVDKICTCIQGKLSESDQATLNPVMDDFTEQAKAGKQPAEPTGEKKAALQKFSDAGDTCSKDVK